MNSMMWLAVGLGGALGAMARYAITLYFVPSPGRFPLATFTANVVGCLLMGVLYVLIVEKHQLAVAWRPWLMVGFLGALTTFSTFALESLLLWQGQHTQLAMIYLVASVAASLLAVWLGYTATNLVMAVTA